MTGIRSVDDLAAQIPAIVIERHVEKLRPDPRVLPWRTFRASASEQSADIAETGCAEWRPAEQPSTENANRNCDGKFPFEAGKGGDRKRHDPSAHLDAARKHDRISRTKHLQQRIQKNDGYDAGDEGKHRFNIVASAGKSRRSSRRRAGAHLI